MIQDPYRRILRTPTKLLHGLAVALVLTACGTGPDPTPRTRPEASFGIPPRPGGLLADMEVGIGRGDGANRSGFHLLESNEDGLRWRLALADTAVHSLDLQYYVWWGDDSGRLLMRRVVDAADRGVKVRMILDDLSSMLEDETHPRVRDHDIGLVNLHPNIEIRLFNPWHRRSLVGRAVELTERLERINHRMHNKLMVADNRAAIIGGRNIGNEYFGLSHEFNFRDLDVLGIGPVARQATSVFDRFWNSDWVTPAARFAADVKADEAKKQREDIDLKLAQSQRVARLPLRRRDWSAEFTGLSRRLHFGSSQVHTDTPRPDALTHHMPAAIRRLMGSARHELLVTNAYIIPDASDVAHLREISARGTRIRILTNSLASHDVPAVNSHYKQWRRPLIDAGVELHEIRSDAAIQSVLADTAPTRAEFMGLHVKAIVVDRQRVFIGSMNLDPRSSDLNSEMGVIIDSRELATALAESMERDMAPENAWRITPAEDGSLRWTAGSTVLQRQPARSLWQRIQDQVFMAFPRDLY